MTNDGSGEVKPFGPGEFGCPLDGFLGISRNHNLLNGG
ncbi:hypothetical protein UFOVP655_28 [uncultured Caudovirales phage]|uniref:Uncharacterized protein n=1 Tax=uncultured Caudovirales phage TaxID=2100421 RepID=A0A6J5NB34_9CAUD|nr:hypothetical protein UFOVP655_28 [uncultured Caudovirales phage]